MRRRGVFAATLAVTAFAGSDPGFGSSLTVAPERCQRTTSTLKSVLAPSWRPFLRFINTCDVNDARGRLILRIIAVDVDTMDQDLRNRSPSDIPKPALIDAKLKNVGALAVNYPGEGPTNTIVRFTNFKDGWPQLVTTRIESISAMHEMDLPPLHWNARNRIYN